jgi:hypothetical protein
VVVVARQQLRDERGNGRVREIALDLRAVRTPEGWQLSAVVDPPRPPPLPTRPGGPTDAGVAVLTSSAVDLSDPTRADIDERRVSDGILGVVAALGERWRLQVQVAVTGHPGTVFPTTHTSNHAVGRAVDVVAVDGRPVSDIPRDDPLLTEVMTAAARAGATEVGGPVALPGSGFFTDEVHQDHIHIGISAGRPPAAPG